MKTHYFTQTGKLNRFLLTLITHMTTDAFGKRLNLASMQGTAQKQVQKKKKDEAHIMKKATNKI